MMAQQTWCRKQGPGLSAIVVLGLFFACGCDPAAEGAPDASAREDGGITDGGGSGSGGSSGADAGMQHDADPGEDEAGLTDAGHEDAGADGGTAHYPGVPVVLVPVSHIASATVIGVDDEYVYWTSSWVGSDPADPLPPASGSYLLRIPKEGGTPEVIYEAPAGENPIHQGFFALSDTSVYIKRGIDIYHDSLIKVAKDGSSAVEIAQPEFNSGSGVAIDSQRVYFGRNVLLPNGEINSTGSIASVPLDGGPITTVVDATMSAQKPIEPGSGNEVPWQGIEGMMSDGTNLYYASGSNGHMMQVPVGGGVPRILFQADATAVNGTVPYVYVTSWPCVTGGFVYWTTYGSVFKTSIDEGGTPTPVVVSPISAQGSGPQTVTDGDYLYYVDDTFLKKVSVDGGTPVIIAEPGGFSVFAIDDTSVYMIGSNGQSIVKYPK